MILRTYTMDYDAVILEAFGKARKVAQLVNQKGIAQRPLGIGASGDLTYEIDRAVEASILEVLTKHFKRFCAITEESGVLGRLDDKPILLIDPVDGSTNASHSIPMYSSSLAISDGERFNDIIAAGVVDLVHGDVILGGKSRGVFCNGKPTLPSRTEDLQKAVICLDARIGRELPKFKKGLTNLLTSARHPRDFGSAAIGTAYVAAGRVDAFVQLWPRLRSYDCLPALHLVKKAGGAFKFFDNTLSDPDLRETCRRFAYVATGNKRLCETILSILKVSNGEN